MNKGKLIFESYNRAIEKAYDKYFENNGTRHAVKNEKDEQEEVRSLVLAAIKDWEISEISELQGLTPVRYFNSIKDRDSLMELFKISAVLCDEGPPEVFLKTFAMLGDEAVGGLLAMACDLLLVSDKEDGFLIPLAALKVLGNWKVEGAVIPLISFLLKLTEEDDIFLEGIKDALTSIGIPAINPLVRELSETDGPSLNHEYLLMALSDIGSQKHSDEVYRCLKNTFIKMDNKVIGAICLGNYGDGRAIPMLRSFVEKNRPALDTETYYELESVIQRLGGNTEGL